MGGESILLKNSEKRVSDVQSIMAVIRMLIVQPYMAHSKAGGSVARPEINFNACL